MMAGRTITDHRFEPGSGRTQHLCAHVVGDPVNGYGCLRPDGDHVPAPKAREPIRPTTPELTLDDLRSVTSFERWMIEKLDRNKHKGNRAAWISEAEFPMEHAKARLVEEVAELLMALATDAPSRTIIEEAADVANIAMMIADKTGELRTLTP